VSEEKHLSGEQIDRLIEVEVGGPDGQVPDALLAEAQDHLATCAKCQKLVAMYREFYRTLSLAGRATSGRATSDCPSERSLHELAAGVIPLEQQHAVLNHVIHCDHCGGLLRDALEIFSDRQDETERITLAKLESGEEKWQRDVARQLSAQVEGRKPGQVLRPKLHLPRWPRWAPALVSLAVVLLLGASIIWMHTRTPSIAQADRLLVQSYGERRTMRMRFPGAPFSTVVEQRGNLGGSGSFSRVPQALREAEPLIAAGLRRRPQDVGWLQRKARADLLEGRAVPAVASLEMALSEQPSDLTLKTDLASAYFENGESDRALKLLDEIVASDPVNAVALFNRAVLLSAGGRYSDAANAWTRYLEIDPAGEWSSEARAELSKARTLGGAQ